MTSMKRGFVFLAIALCSFSTLALDTYIFFAHYAGTPKLQRHSFTIRSGGSRQDMYGVYNPGVAHVREKDPDIIDENCPPDYVRVHWKSSLHQSYQDFFVTRDDKPSVKARFRWYMPYNDEPYITPFSDPGSYIWDWKSFYKTHYTCSLPYGDDYYEDIWVYLN